MDSPHPSAPSQTPHTPAANPQNSGPWTAAAFLLCLLFALLVIALTDPVGDGSWFWYSVMYRDGQRLYAGLHLALQPMLPLEFALFQRLFGTRWLPSRLLGLFNALLYSTGLALVLRFLPWKQWQRALLLLTTFVVTSDFITFRYDDYHVLSACFAVYSIFALLKLYDAPTPRRQTLWLAVLGLLSGACLTNRLNDGAALCGSVLFIVLLTQRPRRLLSAAIVAAVAALTSIAVVLATGDSLRAWWSYTVTGAAAIKGGTHAVLLYPLRLPIYTVFLLLASKRMATVGAVWSLILAAALVAAVRRVRRKDGTRSWPWIAAAAIALAGSALALHFAPDQTQSIIEVLVLAMVVLCAAVLIRQRTPLLHPSAPPTRRRELLLLVPMGQLVSIAMSSGHWYPNAFPPVAEFLLVLPFAAPPIALTPQLTRPRLKTLFLIVAAILLITTSQEKLHSPFGWWNYVAGSPSAPRVWYNHPTYGPMLIETGHLDFFSPVCQTIATQSTPPAGTDDRSNPAAAGTPELLSLPFSYANYFCAIPPWRGYAQTFFDTSSKQTIDALIAQLDQSPPQWILYQRQMDVLGLHEIAFNAGHPLPHRDLDTLIMVKLSTGQWKLALQGAPREERPLFYSSTWLLIRTR